MEKIPDIPDILYLWLLNTKRRSLCMLIKIFFSFFDFSFKKGVQISLHFTIYTIEECHSYKENKQMKYVNVDDVLKPSVIKMIRRKFSDGLLWVPKKPGQLPPPEVQEEKYHNAENAFHPDEIKIIKKQFQGGMLQVFPLANTEEHKRLVIKCHENGIRPYTIAQWMKCTPRRISQILYREYGSHFPKPLRKLHGSDIHYLHQEVEEMLEAVEESENKKKNRRSVNNGN